MRTIAIKFKTLKSYTNIIDNGNLHAKILGALLAATGILALCYLFFLGNMVFNIVQRKALEAKALTLSNQVGDLELQYLALSNKVDLPLSYSLGFQEAKPVFATRQALGALPVVKDKNEI